MTPPDRPFPHSDTCKTRDAAPEWEKVADLHWQRTCSCHVQHHYGSRERPARPSPAEVASFVHGLDPETDRACDGAARVRWVDEDRMWRIDCRVCGVAKVYVPYTRRVGADGQLEPLPVGARMAAS